MVEKILQLYRSTNVWLTRNMAKAMVELHAKNLHDDNPIATVRDGEPIVGRYYDKSDNYSFEYTVQLQNDPYICSTSATHIYKDGFDSFVSKPLKADYDSAAFIRVGSGENWEYWQLQSVPLTNPAITDDVSIGSVFGVACVSGDDVFVEWFDNEIQAKSFFTTLNLIDEKASNEFTYISGTHQVNGRLLPLHSTLSADKAIETCQKKYEWVLVSSEDIPSNYVWDNTNTYSAKPLPSATMPLFIRINEGNAYTYFMLHNKGITISLKIDDTNNVLSQENDKLSVNFILRQLTNEEISTEYPNQNIIEGYRLFGTSDGTETQIGDTIKIYGPQTIYSIYYGHVDDRIVSETNPTVIPGIGNSALCFIWLTPTGQYSLITVDISVFVSYNDFKDGFSVNHNNISVKLYVSGGLEYGPEIQGNKSVKIKIDNESKYFSRVNDGDGEYEKVNIYEWRNGNDLILTTTDGSNALDVKTYIHSDYDYYIENEGVIISSFFKTFATNGYIQVNSKNYDSTGNVYIGYIAATHGDYSLKTFLYINENGLGVRSDAINESVLSIVKNSFRINGESFIYNPETETFDADITGNNMTIGHDSEDINTVTHKNQVPEYGDPKGIYECNGKIYLWDGTQYTEWELDGETKISDAITILSYMTKNMDLGVYTTPGVF